MSKYVALAAIAAALFAGAQPATADPSVRQVCVLCKIPCIRTTDMIICFD